MPKVSIDVFSDIMCPWCFIGTERIESVLSSWSDPLDVTLTLRPFLLDPTVPAEGQNLQEMLRAKYGRDPKAMFAPVEAAARESGIPLDFSKQQNVYSTVACHTLLRHAEAKGTQRALSRALFRAYFLDGKNVADANILASIAGEHGFSHDEVIALVGDAQEEKRTRAEAASAASKGIRGVPFFVFNGKFALSGAQPAETFRAAILKSLQVGE